MIAVTTRFKMMGKEYQRARAARAIGEIRRGDTSRLAEGDTMRKFWVSPVLIDSWFAKAVERQRDARCTVPEGWEGPNGQRSA